MSIGTSSSTTVAGSYSPFYDVSRSWVLVRANPLTLVIDLNSIGVTRDGRRYATVIHESTLEAPEYRGEKTGYLLKEAVYDCKARTTVTAYVAVYDPDKTLLTVLVGSTPKAPVTKSTPQELELKFVCSYDEAKIKRVGDPELTAPNQLTREVPV